MDTTTISPRQLQVAQALEAAGFWETHPPDLADEDWESCQEYEIAFDHWSGYWVFVCDSDGQNWVYNAGEYLPEQSPDEVISWVRQLITSAPTVSPNQLRQEERKELEEGILLFLLTCQHPAKLAEIRQQFPSARWALFNDAKDALDSKGLIVAPSIGRQSTYQLTPKGIAHVGGVQ